MYYLRTRPKADAIQFTVDQSKLGNKASTPTPTAASYEPEECLSCGS
jgi:ribonucleoside-diphosphate reductase alpha chain/ribonucleoside-diphosphate reductase subunit M1